MRSVERSRADRKRLPTFPRAAAATRGIRTVTVLRLGRNQGEKRLRAPRGETFARWGRSADPTHFRRRDHIQARAMSARVSPSGLPIFIHEQRVRVRLTVSRAAKGRQERLRRHRRVLFLHPFIALRSPAGRWTGSALVSMSDHRGGESLSCRPAAFVRRHSFSRRGMGVSPSRAR